MSRLVGASLLAACLLAACLLPASMSVQAQVLPRIPLVVRGAETPIQLQQASLAVEIGGGVADTTVELAFHNPNDRMLEGELQFPLGPGQRVTGFALDFGGEMRPAVPVEKARGRQVFEQIVRRGVDPALLETTQGNNFKLRIYPIPPRGERRVRVRIAQLLARANGRWTYTLPLPYAAGAQAIEATVRVHGATEAPALPDAMTAVPFEKRGDAYEASLPRAALANGALTVSSAAATQARAYTGQFAGDAGEESYFYAEIPVPARPVPRALPKIMTLLWDSSGSGANRRHDLEFALLDRYFRAAGEIEVRLLRLRDRPEAPRSFRVSGADWSALRRELEATVYDGATALGGWDPQRDAGEYLLFSDGLENYGARTFPTLLPGQRLFAVDAGAGADTVRLNALAQRAGGRLVRLDAGTADAAAGRLLTDGPRIARLEGDGVTALQAESMEAVDGILRVAGRRQRPDGVLRVLLEGDARAIEVPVTNASPAQPLAPLLWAGWRIDSLQADAGLTQAEMTRLGKRFGIATPGTSLIVLDRVDDYVRYDIAPPPALRRAFEQMKALRTGERSRAGSEHLARVLRELDAKLAWWKSAFPKGPLPLEMRAKAGDDMGALPPPPPPARGKMPPPAFLPPMPAPEVQRRADQAQAAEARALATATAQRMAEAKERPPIPVAAPAPPPAPAPASAPATRTGNAPIGIALQKWTADARYLDRLRRAGGIEAYAIYLDEKPDFANSTGFYLDVADILFEKGKRDLALRVLSNLAEMDLENRHILRVLGYRLMQAGAPELALPVFQQVLRLAEDEPQSWRDLGLAYAAVKRPQEAVDTLLEVALRDWDARFSEVELITLADMNAVIAANKGRVDTSRIDPRLLRHMPLDLRVVLTWDADNSDMDLWVTDPNGERCWYMRPRSYQGGRLSRDATGGYGPEEFSLRDAKPGKYKVEANFYGHRQQLVSSSTTLQLKLVTGFGTPRAKEQMVTLRLRGQGESVFVGEFEVPAGKR